MRLPYLLYLQQWHSTLWNDVPPTHTHTVSPRSPVGTTLLHSSARRSAKQRTRRGSRVDLWTCSTSSCRRTPGAGSAAMTTTSKTCRDPSWSDRWPKSAWWGKGGEDGWMNGGRERKREREIDFLKIIMNGHTRICQIGWIFEGWVVISFSLLKRIDEKTKKWTQQIKFVNKYLLMFKCLLKATVPSCNTRLKSYPLIAKVFSLL